jgi:23S rRNA (cytosine1962-C5)-methyltransferase
MRPLFSGGWNDYELIDSGGKEKLERFGKYRLRRPEPQALWNKSRPADFWDSNTDAFFIRTKIKLQPVSDISGQWEKINPIPNEWLINIPSGTQRIRMILKLTSSGHIGIFPEQVSNWEYIAACISDLAPAIQKPRILNLFAYTGASSLVALAAGAEVFHLDSVKPIINWTEKNRESSGLPKLLHLVVEDAVLFMKREVKRGNMYHGIIMDPPSYGRGPAGEKWIFENGINELISCASKILDPGRGFFILNWYSLGLSPYVMLNLVNNYFRNCAPEFGDMVITSPSGNYLPLGTYLRFMMK